MTTSIATVAELEGRIGKASALVHMKSIDHLDRGALDWVGSSPLMFAGFADASGIGVTLGGGRPGWATPITCRSPPPCSTRPHWLGQASASGPSS